MNVCMDERIVNTIAFNFQKEQGTIIWRRYGTERSQNTVVSSTGTEEIRTRIHHVSETSFDAL